jgi:hypothetical protein
MSIDKCSSCYKSRNEQDCMGIRAFSKDNDMDPYPLYGNPFSHLPKPHPMELQLIARAHPCFKAYVLPGNGDYAYKGNVCNIEQDITTYFTQLPPRLEDMPHCIVRKEYGHSSNRQFRDFKVRRDIVHGMLAVLRRTFQREYGEVQINGDNLNAIPADGNVFSSIPQVQEPQLEDHVSQFSRQSNQQRTQQSNQSSNESADEPPAPVQEDETENQLELGPEQGGATGQHPEDGDPNQLQAEYVPQSIQRHGMVEEGLQAALGSAANPMAWPEHGNRLSDYNTAFLQAKCFPYLFPHGCGDATMKDRRKAVSLAAATRHLLWYAMEKPDGSFYYPFANDERWMYWAQNTCERHRFQTQKGVYIDQNPQDAELTVDQINDFIAEGNQDRLREITARMSMFARNILGSNAYLYSKRKELESLFEVKGMPTLWFTFSAADNQWFDFHHSDQHPTDPNASAKEAAKERRKFVRDNPHLVDSLFYERVKLVIGHWLGVDSLNAEYVWFRVEYQERGTAHVHGCLRLKSDPGLVSLADRVLQGKQAQRRLEQSCDPDDYSNVGFIPAEQWDEDE